MNTTMKSAMAAAIAGAMVVSAATPLLAAPVFLNSTGVTAAVTSDVIDVRYRGRGGRGFGPGAAVALGAMAIIGGIAAQQSYGPAYDQGYYDPGYGPAYGPGYGPAYGPGYGPAYGYAPGYAPGYYAPGYMYAPGYRRDAGCAFGGC